MMKLFNKVMSVAILVGSVIVLSGCPGDKDATDPKKVQLGKLSKAWTIVATNGAVYDGTDDRTTAFAGFQLTISGTFNSSNPDGPYQFQVTAGSMQEPSPWPMSGTWTFNSVNKGSNSGTLVRSDSVPMSYNINSSGQLILTFDCPDGVCNYDGARTVAGTWQFTLQ